MKLAKGSKIFRSPRTFRPERVLIDGFVELSGGGELPLLVILIFGCGFCWVPAVWNERRSVVDSVWRCILIGGWLKLVLLFEMVVGGVVSFVMLMAVVDIVLVVIGGSREEIEIFIIKILRTIYKRYLTFLICWSCDMFKYLVLLCLVLLLDYNRYWGGLMLLVRWLSLVRMVVVCSARSWSCSGYLCSSLLEIYGNRSTCSNGILVLIGDNRLWNLDPDGIDSSNVTSRDLKTVLEYGSYNR